jgi:hypothetical protein
MRSETKAYTAQYYETNVDASAVSSAQQLVPFLVEHLSPRSLLELGSGAGVWSKAVLNAGVADVLAVDGPWVTRQMLRVPAENFLPHNLAEPLALARSFDLALCLEVGEHIEHQAADVLVDSLTRHAPVVVFGAAMPFQGGTRHINEQWPAYWREKFQARGYYPIDAIRPIFWNNPRVAYYYKQNTFIYCCAAEKAELIDQLQTLAGEKFRSSADFVFIHPDKYLELSTFENVNVRRMLKKGPGLLGRAILNRLKNFR